MTATIQNLDPRPATAALLGYDSQAYGNSDVVSGSRVNLYGALATNKGATTLYLMFFDATALPANTAVPKFMPIPLAQNSPIHLFMNDVPGHRSMYGWTFTAGLVWAASTTSNTLTVDTSSSVWVTLRYA